MSASGQGPVELDAAEHIQRTASRPGLAAATNPNWQPHYLRAPSLLEHTASQGRLAVRRRLAREWNTVVAMLRIYCRDHHQGALCHECEELQRYVSARLERCRFGEDKPTCAKCPVHCYQRERREQIKAVMRYAGPRMLWEHPWLSLRHLLDGWFRRPVAGQAAGR